MDRGPLHPFLKEEDWEPRVGEPSQMTSPPSPRGSEGVEEAR